VLLAQVTGSVNRSPCRFIAQKMGDEAMRRFVNTVSGKSSHKQLRRPSQLLISGISQAERQV
jgi:hypothetical protein